MSEIKRYATRVADGGVVGMIEDEDGGWVMYIDHVAAVRALTSELSSNPCELTPDPKFKVGDRVTWEKGADARDAGVGNVLSWHYNDSGRAFYYWIAGDVYARESLLTLYVPPTPEAKFSIGDLVVKLGIRDGVHTIIRADCFAGSGGGWQYELSDTRFYWESDIDLYIAPTPAELTPTLVDRVRDMKHACIQAVQYVLDDYEEYEVTTKEIKFAILKMLRNTEVTYDEPETEVK